jgi:hypothetical protein
VVDTDGFVPSFRDLNSLSRYADRNGYSLETEEPVLHDLDWAMTWLVTKSDGVNCRDALSAWNLFSDVAASVSKRKFAFVDLNLQFPTLYQKLFRGNNLPAATPTGELYVPHWSEEEINSVADVLTTGLELFTSSVREWAPKSNLFAWRKRACP